MFSLTLLSIFAVAAITGVVLQYRAEDPEDLPSAILRAEAVGIVLCILLSAALLFSFHSQLASESTLKLLMLLGFPCGLASFLLALCSPRHPQNTGKALVSTATFGYTLLYGFIACFALSFKLTRLF